MRRAIWRSRRGLLELDLYLYPFANNKYSSLTPTDSESYHALIEEDDVDILDWINGQEPVPKKYLSIIKAIRNYKA